MKQAKHFGMNPIGIYEKALPVSLSWQERLNRAADAGYDFVEMSIDESEARLSRLEWRSEDRLMLRRSIEESGVPILTMGLSCHRKFALGSSSQEIRNKGLEILHSAIELAGDLGIRIIQLMGYDVFYETSNEDTRARYLDGLKQGAKWAGAAGVMLALENVDVKTVDSVEKALHFVQEVNSPWLTLYPDVGNLVAAGYDPINQLRLAKSYLVGLHIKDALPEEVRGVVFGKGDVPFGDVFQTLAEMDFSGPIVVEMWAHLDTSGDPFSTAAKVFKFVCQLVETNA